MGETDPVKKKKKNPGNLKTYGNNADRKYDGTWKQAIESNGRGAIFWPDDDELRLNVSVRGFDVLELFDICFELNTRMRTTR